MDILLVKRWSDCHGKEWKFTLLHDNVNSFLLLMDVLKAPYNAINKVIKIFFKHCQICMAGLNNILSKGQHFDYVIIYS